MAVTAAMAVIVAKAKSFRPVLKILYTVFACAILALLLFISVVSFLLLKRKNPLGVETFLETSWKNTVATAKDDACKVQKELSCYGFRDDFCVGCWSFNNTNERVCSKEQTPSCPKCDGTSVAMTDGCYSQLLRTVAVAYRPLGIVSAIFAGVVLLDIVVACAL